MEGIGEDRPATIWVAVLYISDRVAEQVIGKHRLHPDDVRSAILCRTGLRFTWDDHPERGLRAIVETHISGRDVLVVLYPIGDESHLGWHTPTRSAVLSVRWDTEAS